MKVYIITLSTSMGDFVEVVFRYKQVAIICNAMLETIANYSDNLNVKADFTGRIR